MFMSFESIDFIHLQIRHIIFYGIIPRLCILEPIDYAQLQIRHIIFYVLCVCNYVYSNPLFTVCNFILRPNSITNTMFCFLYKFSIEIFNLVKNIYIGYTKSTLSPSLDLQQAHLHSLNSLNAFDNANMVLAQNYSVSLR